MKAALAVPILIGVVDHLVAGPHHRDLLGRAEEGRPHERHAASPAVRLGRSSRTTRATAAGS